MRLAPVFLALLLAAAPLAVSPVAAQAADPDPSRFEERINDFYGYLDARNSVPADPILFVGSSTARIWKTAERFPALPVVNRGFGGSHISDVIHWIEETVLRHRPRVVVFYAGDNDIAAGKSPDQVRDDFREFLDRLHAALPGTPVVFLAIKPSMARWEYWPAMQQANEAIRVLAEQNPTVHLLDMADEMLGPDGAPREELFVEDGLHLSEAGYDLWTERLSVFLGTLDLDADS